MEAKLIINGRLPCLNDYIEAMNSSWSTGNRLKQAEQDRIGWLIKVQLRQKFDKPVNLHYHWVEPNAKRDKDNIAGFGMKVIQDALVQMKVLKNDGWKYIQDFDHRFSIDKDNPRIEVIISDEEARP